jgi:uncharacterized repeat protein (TIGR01451 family)
MGVQAATIAIVPGAGFDDETPVDPVGGNPGTTVGQQRLFIFQEAARIWGATIQSDIEIKVNASFADLGPCSGTFVLGAASSIGYFSDPQAFPRPNTWYTHAFADMALREPVNPATNQIQAQFNSRLNNPALCTSVWYMGFDGNHGANIDLLTVIAHEFAHGLYFIDQWHFGGTCTEVSGKPDAFETLSFSLNLNKHYHNMTSTERCAQERIPLRTVWDGPYARTQVPFFQQLGNATFTIDSPDELAGDYLGAQLGTAQWGTSVGNPPISGNVQLVPPNDAGHTIACNASDGEPQVFDPGSFNGKIAIIDRGSDHPTNACTFVKKCKAVQVAGAIGCIIANNVAGDPIAMGGDDPTITLEALMVSQSFGAAIKAALQTGTVAARFRLTGNTYPGASTDGRPFLYTPTAFTGGSSVDHFETVAVPPLLMAPSISGLLHRGNINAILDLTSAGAFDIGWRLQTDDTVAIAKVGTAAAVAGTDIAYTTTVRNNGYSESQNVIAMHPTPGGLTRTSSSCSDPCLLGNLQPGSTRTITDTFHIPSGYQGPGAIVASASVTASTTDPDLTNNNASISADAGFSADMAAALAPPANFHVGGNVQYVATITNNGPSDAANVMVNNAPPAGLTFVSNAGDCTTAFPCNLGALAAGASRLITITYSVPANFNTGTGTANAITVSSPTPDPNMANNSASAQLSVRAPTARPGTAQTVKSGDAVTLDGSQSSDPNSLSLTYAWLQTAGPPAPLTSNGVAKPQFIAPSVTSTAKLTFTLTVTNTVGSSSADSVDVNVNPLESLNTSPPPSSKSGCGCGTTSSSPAVVGATIVLIWLGRRRERSLSA